MTTNAGDGVVVDELLRDDPDCPVFGFNLACAYPFPEIAAQFYHPIAARLSALDPGVYVYPEWETHITIVTFVNFNMNRRPDAARRAQLESLLDPVYKILRTTLETSKPFHLTLGAPVLTPKAAILPISDVSGEIGHVRRNVLNALQANTELYDKLSRAGLNVPGIVHSTVMRFAFAPKDYQKFAAEFNEAFRDVPPVEITINELLLTTETKPYMREGTVACRFPLAPNYRAAYPSLMPEKKVDWVRLPTLKTPENFRKYSASLGLNLPCDDQILTSSSSPLSSALAGANINGKRIGNRFAVQPMEGWDGTRTGGLTDEVLRRWTRFGESGAKLIWGGEAMAIRPDGRANPNQLVIQEQNKADLARLRDALVNTHRERHGTADDLVVGFQLTHSGRFCRPNDAHLESRVAYRHPILDKKFKVTDDSKIFTDTEIRALIGNFIKAAGIARDIGADFVDIKHCHGYLLHEFLSAYTRPGDFGGSFENRTRILREIVEGIRAGGNRIEIGVRLSAFDCPPFKTAPASAESGKLGRGIPEDFPVPYPYGFGVNQQNPLEPDLTETYEFVQLCGRLGIKLLNITAGSPYYCPHIQRPAAYPPSDGYQPPHDPLIDVARQIEVTRQIKMNAPPGMMIVGSAYSYLQEFLPAVAQAVVREGWADMIGLGRMILSYPLLPSDALEKGALAAKFICRTFSDCTTAPRNGMISGCYPLDKFYAAKPEAEKVKALKKAVPH